MAQASSIFGFREQPCHANGINVTKEAGGEAESPSGSMPLTYAPNRLDESRLDKALGLGRTPH
jgi:hypothetical protein